MNREVPEDLLPDELKQSKEVPPELLPDDLVSPQPTIAAAPQSSGIQKSIDIQPNTLPNPMPSEDRPMEWGKLAEKGMSQFNLGITRIPAAAFGVATLPGNLLAKAIGHPEWQTKIPDALINNKLTEFYEERARLNDVPRLQESTVDHILNENYGEAAKVLASQVVVNAPNQLASISAALMGAPAVGLGMLGAMTGGQQTKQAVESAADPAAVGIDILGQGAMEISGESI